MSRVQRLLASPVALASLALLLSCALVAGRAAPARASGSQQTIFEDDSQLHENLDGTLVEFKALGAQRVRVFLPWNAVAPDPNSRHAPSGFSPTNPNSYPAQNWGFYDALAAAAVKYGVAIDLTITGPAPRWATASGYPGNPASPPGEWKPSASQFGKFVRAVAIRYSGSFVPAGTSTRLSAFHFFGIWNEPNYGPDLAPQASHHNTVLNAAQAYRGLLDAAWSGLTGVSAHRHDTILFGEVAPRGQESNGQPGNFGGEFPLPFLRALYCVNSALQPLRGSAAKAIGCPTSAAGSRRFRAANPALFEAAGFADHLYPQGLNPTRPTWPNPGTDQYADMPQLPALEHLLDTANRIYGSHTRFTIYNTEYGYRTNPPDRGLPSYNTASLWLNWAEYLSWRNPRVADYMQYGLVDSALGNFPSGLEKPNGTPKASYNAFRMPLFMPVTSTRRGRRLEVWGCARPVHSASGTQDVQIQLQRNSRGSFTTVKTVSIRGGGSCYFDVRIAFPGSGTVRTAWVDPAVGEPIYSRHQAISVR